jgi:mannuronan synthase
VFFIVTSYRITPETTTHVYRSAIAEAVRYGAPATIVASVVEIADQRLIKALFRQMRPPDHVRLMFVRLPGLGKRVGLGVALRAVARTIPRPDAAVVILDGDALVRPGTLTRCLPLFHAQPGIDGITTDQDALVQGGPWITAWFRWRFAQRHMHMSSLGLSRRLLNMTGRMSLFRIEVATDPSFIQMVEDDHLDHWRLGRFRLLTGEDKSTWLWLLERGRGMLYVPDVRTVTLESPPAPGFFRPTSMLMLRWFGNMLRASGPAIALGPRTVGPFAWWCLIDQRLSMWTPLIGPTVAILFALAYSPVFLYTYLLWIGTTRLLLSLAMLTQRERISGLYPMIFYYNQLYGAVVKSYVLFRLDRQRWTRQNIALERGLGVWQARLHAWGSAYLHGLAMLLLVTAVALWSGVLPPPWHPPWPS